MPNRTIRDWTDSWTIQELSSDEERFLIRLMMKADDFGRFHANTNALKSFLFPLLPDVRLEQVRQWRDKCADVDLISLYRDKNGKDFLLINNFGQRLRQMKTQFPAPCGHKECKLKTECLQHDDRLSSGCQRIDDNLSVEEKGREAKRIEEKGRETRKRENPPPDFSSTEIPSENEVLLYAEMQSIPERSAKSFYAWMEFEEKWINDKTGKLRPWKRRLKQWAEEDKLKGSNGKGIGNSQKVDRNQDNANRNVKGQYDGVGLVVDD